MRHRHSVRSGVARRSTAMDMVTTAPRVAAAPIPVMRPWMGAAEARAVADAVASGWVAQGPRVAEFERAMEAAVGATHAVALSSCTTALHLALLVQGIGAGDEVVLPSLTFIACANAVVQVGAVPVFADVDPHTLGVTPESLARAFTARTRAVLAVHQAGTPVDIEAIHGVCDPAGIAVIEDAACAIGSLYRGRPVGAHSDLVAFSFHPRKLVTTGEGGMLTTRRAAWAERLRRLREHGTSMSAVERHSSATPVLEHYLEPGFNYRMTDLQAALGIVQLQRLDRMVARRRVLAALYSERLSAIGGLRWSTDPPYGRSNFQSYWVLLPEEMPSTRDEVMARMQEAGISTRRGIMACHLETAHAGRPRTELPVTEVLADRALILPLYHQMTETDVDRVVDALEAAILEPR